MALFLDHWFPAALISKPKHKMHRARHAAALRCRPHLEGLETRIVLSTMAGVDGSSDSAQLAPSGSSSSALQAMATASQEAEAQGSLAVPSAADLLPITLHRPQLLDADSLLLRGNFAGQLFQTITNIVATLTPEQGAEQGILRLELGPIDLNVLGLVIETSPICLEITADSGLGGAIGNLLNNISERLSGPATLGDILSGLNGRLSSSQITNITNQLTVVLQRALNQLLDGAAVAATPTQQPADGVCPILNLSLGPVDLSLLGLNVSLDDCNEGPVVVDIYAVEGPGNLLGNLLCDLTGLLDGQQPANTAAREVLGLQADSAQLTAPNRYVLNGSFMGQQFSKIGVVTATLTPPAEGEESGILHLRLNPIHLDVLGLVVDTSAICLEITAQPGQGNLLGNLLTNVAGLLDGPANLQDIRTGLDGRLGTQFVATLERQIGNLITAALNRIFAILTAPTTPTGTPPEGVCNILDLAVGPVNLNLLGLQVNLDDCEGGPVRVQVTAEQGPGNLLGNLLCGLVHTLDDLNAAPAAMAADRYFADVA